MIVGNDRDGGGRSTHPFRDNIYLQAIWFGIKLFNVLLLFMIEIFK